MGEGGGDLIRDSFSDILNSPTYVTVKSGAYIRNRQIRGVRGGWGDENQIDFKN